MTIEDDFPTVWQKAATDAGIRPGLPVSDAQWLEAWQGYSKARMEKFRTLVTRLTDTLSELRGALTGVTDRIARRKAHLEEIADGPTRRAELAALLEDEILLVKTIEGLKEIGIGLQETHS